MIKVNEIFYSLQGEGVYAGTPAVFVRLSGCNRSCEFCDTDFNAYTRMSENEIVNQVVRYGANHVVITGGEPTLQLKESLLEKLHQEGKYIQIETNGTRPVPEGVDWVTCSPKEGPWEINRVDELKVVFTGQDVEAILKEFAHLNPAFIELQPCSGQNIKETIDYILSHPHWRLSLQTHKFVNIQ